MPFGALIWRFYGCWPGLFLQAVGLRLARKIEPELCHLKRRSAVTVQAEGQFWLGTSKVDDWTRFASGQLGLQKVDRGGGLHAFSPDDRNQRTIVDDGLTDRERFLGREIADA